MSVRDRKREREKKREVEERKPKTFWEKLRALFWTTVWRIVQVAVYILIGITCITHARFSQTALLPDCATYHPYTNEEAPSSPETIHADYLITKNKDGEQMSVKAKYIPESVIKEFENSFMFNNVRAMIHDKGSTTISYYIGSVLQGMILAFYGMHNMMYKFVNGTLPEWAVVMLSPYVLMGVYAVSGIWCIIQGAYNVIFGIKKLFAEGGDGEPWEEPEEMFDITEPQNIFFMILIIIVLILCFGLIMPLLYLFAIVIGVIVFLTPVLMNRWYSTVDEVAGAIQQRDERLLDEAAAKASADDATEKLEDNSGDSGDDNKNDAPVTDDSDTTKEAPQSGGADDEDEEGEDEDDDEDDDDDDDDDEEEEKDAGNVGNNTLPFNFQAHAMGFLRLYKHWIIIYMSLMLIYDMKNLFGNYAAGACVFAIIIMYAFTTIYKATPVNELYGYTKDVIGTFQAEKECSDT
jgi:hypothetical protein